jgi:hypothetical protein
MTSSPPNNLNNTQKPTTSNHNTAISISLNSHLKTTSKLNHHHHKTVSPSPSNHLSTKTKSPHHLNAASKPRHDRLKPPHHSPNTSNCLKIASTSTATPPEIRLTTTSNTHDYHTKITLKHNHHL